MRPTSSSLWLAELCPASHALPQIRETSTAQAKGSAVHRYLERAPAIGKDAALAELDEEHRELCAELEPSDIPAGEREVMFVYDLANRVAIVAGRGLARNYPTAPGTGCGTADLIAPGEVWDYKTGRPGPAAESLQMLSLGLYSARSYGWPRVTVGHLQVDGDRLRPDSAALGPLDLAAAHERIALIYARHELALHEPGAAVYPGAHCTDCAAQPQCPATMALATRAAAAAWAAQDAELAPAGTAAAAWEFLGRVEDFAKRLRGELKRQAAAAPIPLENSRQLALVAVDKSRIDGKLGLPILRAAVGDRADAACSVSKAGLAQIAGKGAAKVLLEQLGRAGAVEEWTEQHLREVKAPVAVLEPHDHELAHTAPPSRGDGG